MAAAKQRDPWGPDVLAGLERDLGQGLARAYVLRGEERYFRERALAMIVARAKALGHELVRHDGNDPDFSAASLLDDLTGSPMFAEARCIVARDPEAQGLLEKRGDGSPSGFTRAVQRLLEDASRPGCLVISSRSLRADHAVSKAVKDAGGALLAFRKLWDSPPPWNPDPAQTELARYTLARARELGVRLTPQQAAYVGPASGNDLAQLDTQLEKLRAAGGGSLTETVGWEASAAPWELADPLLAGELPKVLLGLTTLFALGFESSGKREKDPAALANVLIGSVRNKLRQTIAGAHACAAGRSAAAAAEAAGVKGPPQALAAFEARLGARPPEAWERMLAELGELERRTRTGATVDQNDFVLLALRWSRGVQRSAPATAPARRGPAARR